MKQSWDLFKIVCNSIKITVIIIPTNILNKNFYQGYNMEKEKQTYQKPELIQHENLNEVTKGGLPLPSTPL